HILLECNSIERHLIWYQTRELWPHDPQEWPDITLGMILGTGSVSLPDRRRPTKVGPSPVPFNIKGKTRLLQILISEESHLIWVLRCGRAINGEIHTVQQIKNRWLKVINERLTMDRII
ncbi:hypothetical protein BJV74DRAFT_743462, partial [Russula compacta]